MTKPTCPSCGVAMKEGFIPDYTGHSAFEMQEWTGDPPKKTFWGNIDLRDKERIPVSTWRCPKCGLLQSYARATDAPG